MNRDQAIIEAYSSIGVSADRIAVFGQHRHEFLSRLPTEIRAEGDDDIIWRLLQLRKVRRLPSSPLEN